MPSHTNQHAGRLLQAYLCGKKLQFPLLAQRINKKCCSLNASHQQNSGLPRGLSLTLQNTLKGSTKRSEGFIMMRIFYVATTE